MNNTRAEDVSLFRLWLFWEPTIWCYNRVQRHVLLADWDFAALQELFS